ncbi:MAG: right-handed parallel beta-helix repeat-containing protein, partial [Pirellulaceae bacterium]|nr:right-handed parallel beta-helix repeat-containing protein [Pirellulaceae bacterium]
MPLDQLSAQTGEMMPGSPAMPFTDGYQGVVGTRDMALRINYDTKRYGQDNGQFGVGVQGHRPRDNGLWLFSAQYNLDFGDIDRMGLNVGGGIRALHQDWLGMGRTRVAGATLWYDGAKTDLDNYFNEFGFSLESLGDQWDFRLNGNFPIGTRVKDGIPIRTGEVGYSGVFLTEITSVPTDEAVTVVDFEVARRISDYDAWILAGGYGLDADSDSAFGAKVGARGWLGSDALLELSLTHDDMFKTRVNFAVVWYPGRSPLFGQRSRCIDDRLRDPVMRNDYIAMRRTHRRGDAPLTDINGDNIRVVHAFSEATAPGDGSYENPFASIDDVFAGSKKGDIVLLWSGSEFDGESIVLRDLQRLLGEGGGVTHMVSTLQLGEVRLPETRPGAWTGPIPEINNAAGPAVTLGAASTNIDVNAVGFNQNAPISQNEVSNLAIDGGNVAGSRGIVSSAVGIGEVEINKVTIANTTGNGIELNPIVITFDDNGTETKVAAFNPTIKNSSFTGVGGDDIHLDWNVVEPASTNVSENIQISNVTSTGAGGWGINIIENQRSATIKNYTFNAGAASDGGIRFDKGAGATVSDTTIAGGAGTSGIGVSVDNESSGSFTFNNVRITNMADAGFHVNGGSANVTFTGLITQNSDLAMAVLVENNHTGTLTFNEMVTNQGVVLATAGA